MDQGQNDEFLESSLLNTRLANSIFLRFRSRRQDVGRRRKLESKGFCGGASEIAAVATTLLDFELSMRL